MLAVVLAILAKLVVILKLGLRSISKRIRSLIFLNIYIPLHSVIQLFLRIVFAWSTNICSDTLFWSTNLCSFFWLWFYYFYYCYYYCYYYYFFVCLFVLFYCFFFVVVVFVLIVDMCFQVCVVVVIVLVSFCCFFLFCFCFLYFLFVFFFFPRMKMQFSFQCASLQGWSYNHLLVRKLTFPILELNINLKCGREVWL